MSPASRAAAPPGRAQSSTTATTSPAARVNLPGRGFAGRALPFLLVWTKREHPGASLRVTFFLPKCRMSDHSTLTARLAVPGSRRSALTTSTASLAPSECSRRNWPSDLSAERSNASPSVSGPRET